MINLIIDYENNSYLKQTRYKNNKTKREKKKKNPRSVGGNLINKHQQALVSSSANRLVIPGLKSNQIRFCDTKNLPNKQPN